MYDLVEQMGDIPLHTEPGNATFLRDVATPKDTAFIQTNVVRVNGERQVYIPVYRQVGSSTLDVVSNLKKSIPDMQSRLSRPNVKLNVVMDQSVYVRHSIKSLAEEGILGAVLCSLVILLFLGDWRMTIIAVMTIPISVVAAIVGLKSTGNTINVMTLAGLSLAIGPLVDKRDHSVSAIRIGTPGFSAESRKDRPPFWGPAKWPCPNWLPACVHCWCYLPWR